MNRAVPRSDRPDLEVNASPGKEACHQGRHCPDPPGDERPDRGHGTVCARDFADHAEEHSEHSDPHRQPREQNVQDDERQAPPPVSCRRGKPYAERQRRPDRGLYPQDALVPCFPAIDLAVGVRFARAFRRHSVIMSQRVSAGTQPPSDVHVSPHAHSFTSASPTGNERHVRATSCAAVRFTHWDSRPDAWRRGLRQPGTGPCQLLPKAKGSTLGCMSDYRPAPSCTHHPGRRG